MPLPLQSSGPGPLVSLVFVAVGVGVLALFARRSVARLLTMLRTDRRAVGDVEPGLVEVEGTVASAGESAGTRTHGAADAEPVVTQYRQSDGEGRDFTLPVPQQFAPEALNEETAVPFYVEDETGRVLVDPAYADVSLESDTHRSDQLTDHTELEAVLEAGDTVYVLGEAVPAGDYADRATPRDGVVASVVRVFEGGGKTTADAVLDDDDLVVTRTASSPAFLVSDTTERRGLLRMGLMAAFWTLSGLFVVVGGLYFFVTGLV
jgi:hypothetical protein